MVVGCGGVDGLRGGEPRMHLAYLTAIVRGERPS